jgi:hypothetical protein
MNDQTPDPVIEVLGEALNYCAHHALEAYGQNNAEDSAAIAAEFRAETAQCVCVVMSGGRKPSTVAVSAIRPNGVHQPLASMSVTPIKFN